MPKSDQGTMGLSAVEAPNNNEMYAKHEAARNALNKRQQEKSEEWLKEGKDMETIRKANEEERTALNKRIQSEIAEANGQNVVSDFS